MKDYIGQIDTSLLSDEILDPAWPGHDRAIGSITSIIVHHEAEIEGTVYDDKSRYEAEARYQAHNPSINGMGLQYHYKIDNVGQIMQIRPLTMTLWHAANLPVNNHSIAICLDGNFETQVPTREQFESLKQLLDWLCTQHPEFPAVQSDVSAHAEVSQLGTACCGKNLRPWVASYRVHNGAIGIPDDAVYQHPELQPGFVPAPPVVTPPPVVPVLAPVTAPVVELPPVVPQVVETPVVEPVVETPATPVPVTVTKPAILGSATLSGVALVHDLDTDRDIAKVGPQTLTIASSREVNGTIYLVTKTMAEAGLNHGIASHFFAKKVDAISEPASTEVPVTFVQELGRELNAIEKFLTKIIHRS